VLKKCPEEGWTWWHVVIVHIVTPSNESTDGCTAHDMPQWPQVTTESAGARKTTVFRDNNPT
jgi:hypothetical protein